MPAIVQMMQRCRAKCMQKQRTPSMQSNDDFSGDLPSVEIYPDFSTRVQKILRACSVASGLEAG